MSEYWFSRLRLRRDVPLSSLLPVLVKPDGYDPSVGKALMWAVFDAQERQRDFLWRDAGRGVYYTVSSRPPCNAQGIFDVDTPKDYNPAAPVGAKYQLSTRCNPTVSSRDEKGRKHRHDVAVHAIKSSTGTVEDKKAVAAAAVRDWFDRQGLKHGFKVCGEFDLGPRTTQQVGKGKQTITFSSVDIEATIEVTDTAAFRSALFEGLGASKVYGCGLLMIRPV